MTLQEKYPFYVFQQIHMQLPWMYCNKFHTKISNLVQKLVPRLRCASCVRSLPASTDLPLTVDLFATSREKEDN